MKRSTVFYGTSILVLAIAAYFMYKNQLKWYWYLAGAAGAFGIGYVASRFIKEESNGGSSSPTMSQSEADDIVDQIKTLLSYATKDENGYAEGDPDYITASLLIDQLSNAGYNFNINTQTLS